MTTTTPLWYATHDGDGKCLLLLLVCTIRKVKHEKIGGWKIESEDIFSHFKLFVNYYIYLIFICMIFLLFFIFIIDYVFLILFCCFLNTFLICFSGPQHQGRLEQVLKCIFPLENILLPISPSFFKFLFFI